MGQSSPSQRPVTTTPSPPCRRPVAAAHTPPCPRSHAIAATLPLAPGRASDRHYLLVGVDGDVLHSMLPPLSSGVVVFRPCALLRLHKAREALPSVE